MIVDPHAGISVGRQTEIVSSPVYAKPVAKSQGNNTEENNEARKTVMQESGLHTAIEAWLETTLVILRLDELRVREQAIKLIKQERESLLADYTPQSLPKQRGGLNNFFWGAATNRNKQLLRMTVALAR